ncbi:MAG: MFS transporter [Candidatus Onthovivens sp.]|nr:MFS transporter [Candidatus Onthovivens sp.]
MKLINRTFTGDVPKATKWLFTSSGMFRDACYQFVSMFLLTFVQFCGLGGVSFEEYLAMYAVITVVVIILRIWDGINDPIMGFIIEKCHFKSGKYRPWIFIGALLNSIVVICMFWILPQGWAYVACFSIFYFLWDFTYTINDIAFWSVLPSLSNDEKVRANLTTLLSIFVSIGTFAVGGIVPMVASGQQEITYKVTAIVTSVLFFLSQFILVIFMKEKKVDKEVEKNDEKIKFKDIFGVLIKNDQLRVSIIAILLYYTGSSILVASGLNYFYFNFGYEKGGSYQLYFTIVYAAATLIAQCLYPLLISKLKMKRMKIFTISSIVTVLSYVGLFCFVFFPNYEKYFIVLCVFAFFAFFGQTLMSLILYIMIQDTIDYNEFKFGERRESSIFSLRAFTAKIASSLQQLILYVSLVSASLFEISNQIANAEREFVGQPDVIKDVASQITGPQNIELWQRVVFQIGFCVVPLLLFLATFILVKKKYKIDEDYHKELVRGVEERKNESRIEQNIQE